MAGNNSKGFMSGAINEVKKEIQRDKEQIKQAVIDEVRSSIGDMAIDVGDIKVTPKMKIIVDGVDLAQFIKLDKSKLQKNIKEYYDEAMNGSDKSSKKFIASMKVALKRGINLEDTISAKDLNHFEDFYKDFVNKVNNELSRIDFSNLIPKSIDENFDSTVGIFKSIIKEARKFGSIEKYLSGISDGTIKATNEMNNLLETVKILSNGKYKFSGLETGSKHLDGIVSDKYTIIARSSEYEEKTNALIPKLKEAEAAGVQLGTIIGTIKDDANDLFYEIQKTQQGKPINSENLDYLQATDEQILKLKKDIETLQKVGLFIDIGAGAENILYGKNGFSFIDLAVPKDLDKIPDYLTNTISGVTEALNESLPFDYATMEVDKNISKQFDSFADTFANISESITSSTKKTNDNLGDFGNEVKNTTNQIDENITGLKNKVEEYNEIISTMKRPAFHVGDISNDYTYKSESLPSILSKGGKFQNIIGSGLYVTEDLEEALQLVSEGYGGGKLHVVDLSDLENQMVRINSQEAHSKYVEQLGKISSYVFKKAKIGNEDYYRQSEGIDDLEQLYNSSREFFEKYDITVTQLDDFIQEAISYAENNSGNWSSHNISTLFQQKLLGALGVDVGNSFDLDNQGIGSLIFDKYDLREIITIDPKDIKQSIKDEITERFFARKSNNAWNSKEDLNDRLDDYRDEDIIGVQKYIKVKKEIADIYNNAIKLQQLDLSSLIPEMNKNNLSSGVTSLPSQMNEITQAEDRMGDEAQEATDQAKQGLAEMREEAEKTEDKIVAMYRAFNSEHGVSGIGVSWFSDNLQTAASYFNDIEYGNKDSLAKLSTDISKFLSIDAKGQDFRAINYNGKIYNTQGLARMAKDLGYAGLELKNVFDSNTDVLKSNIYAIFDENIVKKAENVTQELKPQLEELNKLWVHFISNMSEQSDGRSTDVWRKMGVEFQNVVDEYSSGSITIEQALDRISQSQQSILEADNKKFNFQNKVSDLWKSLSRQSDNFNASYAGYGKNDVWKQTLSEFLNGTVEEEEALKRLEIEFRRVLDLSNETPVSTTDTITNINTETEALEQEKQKAKEVDEAVEKLTEDMRELSNVQLPAVIPLSDKRAEAREAFNKDIRPNNINALYNDGEAGKNAELITYEAKAFDVVSNNAKEAAESKDEFARANREVLQSILTSLAAINSEGNGFANLNKIINSLSKNDKMDKLVKNLERIRDVLNIDINDNSFINAIRDIASQGADLNDIATVLKASASQVNKAKEAVNNKKNTASSNNELDNVEKATKLYKDLYDAQEKQSKIKKGTNVIKYNDLENDITNIINKIKELQLTEEEEAKAKANADKERKSAANAAAESERKLAETREKNIKAAEQEQVQATKQATSMMKNGKLMAEYGDKVRDVLSRIKSINTSVNPEDAVSELKKLRLELTNIQSAAEEAGKSGKSFGQMLVQRFKSLGAYLATFVQFYDIVRYTRQAFSTIMDLDTQLVDLRKTTSMTTSELNQFYIASSDVAKELGVTTSEIISQASAWSRLGYSTKEASTEMAKLSSKFASVSPGMTTENATDYLVSTMQAYGIAVDDVERKVMDNVNRIGNTFATTNAEIGEMLTRSSAAMNAANNSLEETIALESAAVEVTRNAEMTGTAFRTVSMRIRGKQLMPPYSESYMLCA